MVCPLILFISPEDITPQLDTIFSKHYLESDAFDRTKPAYVTQRYGNDLDDWTDKFTSVAPVCNDSELDTVVRNYQMGFWGNPQ